jgi:hypothetical protein
MKIIISQYVDGPVISTVFVHFTPEGVDLVEQADDQQGTGFLCVQVNCDWGCENDLVNDLVANAPIHGRRPLAGPLHV